VDKKEKKKKEKGQFPHLHLSRLNVTRGKGETAFFLSLQLPLKKEEKKKECSIFFPHMDMSKKKNALNRTIQPKAEIS